MLYKVEYQEVNGAPGVSVSERRARATCFSGGSCAGKSNFHFHAHPLHTYFLGPIAVTALCQLCSYESQSRKGEFSPDMTRRDRTSPGVSEANGGVMKVQDGRQNIDLRPTTCRLVSGSRKKNMPSRRRL